VFAGQQGMLARLAARTAFRSPRFLGAAAPVISVSRAREQPSLLKLAGAAALLSAVLSTDEPSSCGQRGPQPAAKKKAAADEEAQGQPRRSPREGQAGEKGGGEGA